MAAGRPAIHDPHRSGQCRDLGLLYNRRRRNRSPESLDQGWAGQLGIPNVGPETFPHFEPRYSAMGPGGRDQQVAEDMSFQNNFTKIVGRHTLKFGYEVVRTRYNALP